MNTSGNLYEIGRIPLDTAVGVGKFLTWPLNFGKTVATNTLETTLRLIKANIDDVEVDEIEKGQESVYEMASYNLDIAATIYYYTELRAEIRQRLGKLAKDKKLTAKNVKDLRNVFTEVKEATEDLQAPEPTDKKAALKMKKYQASIAELNGLCKDFNLDEGDLETFISVRIANSMH